MNIFRALVGKIQIITQQIKIYQVMWVGFVTKKLELLTTNRLLTKC